jgi:UDP-N-acetylglucosamine 2-epimerase
LRQKGRIFGNSVLNTTSSVKNIFSVINDGLKLSHNKFFCSQIVNPYGRGKVTNKVIDVLKKSI